jgi:hypothetical protein
VQVSIAPHPPTVGSLSGRWLEPTRQADFALPTIQNFLGHAQVAWGPTGLHMWVMPPTGLPVQNGLLYRLDSDGRPSRVGPEGTSYRWRPWEVLRRHPTVSSRLRLHWGEAAVTERLTFHEGGSFALLFGGFCRTWRFDSYWNLPPQDDPMLRTHWDGSCAVVEDSKTFGVAQFRPSSAPARVRTFASGRLLLRQAARRPWVAGGAGVGPLRRRRAVLDRAPGHAARCRAHR